MIKLDLSNKNLHLLEITNCDVNFELLELLDLSNNKLSSLPNNFNVLFPNLKILFLTNNLFEIIPECLKFSKITILSIKNNIIKKIENLPLTINWLMATNNKITNMDYVTNLKNLKKLSLGSNFISEIPTEINTLHNLELVRFSNNNIKTINNNFLKLSKLTYVGLGGNPVTPDTYKFIPTINISEIQLYNILGKGASGIVYACSIKNSKENYAVKIFHNKSGVDGLTSTEISVLSILYDVNCQNLVKVIAKLNDDAGVIFEYLENFKTLGNVPNFDTITRDVMTEKINYDTVLFIINGIKNAMNILYKLQIIHGDLYAHNIIYNDNTIKLTDFGASFYVENKEIYEKLHKYEIRAFEYLILDMIQVCPSYKQQILQQLFQR
jgi:hypothetical protein